MGLVCDEATGLMSIVKKSGISFIRPGNRLAETRKLSVNWKFYKKQNKTKPLLQNAVNGSKFATKMKVQINDTMRSYVCSKELLDFNFIEATWRWLYKRGWKFDMTWH